jgi:hypothetical protein
MSKIHVLPDENLGDVLREYIEIDRKAKGGEKIIMKYPLRSSLYKEGDIFTVLESYEIYPAYNDGIEVKENDTYFIYHSEYYTLEPTDIIHIDNKRYRLVNRKAKAGEKVIITETHPTLVYTKIGEIVKIIETDGDTCGGMFKPHDIGEKGAVYHFQYQVLEPVEPVNDIITAEENDSKSVIDLLANLTQRLVELEKRVVAIDEHNNVLIDHLNDVQEKLNQIKVPYFTTFKPNIYFNIHTKEKSAEEIAKEIIKTLNEMISKYNQ